MPAGAIAESWERGHDARARSRSESAAQSQKQENVMQNRSRRVRHGLQIVIVLSALSAVPAPAEIGDALPDAAIGQAGFTDAIPHALGPATFAAPDGIAIDQSVTPNRVYVSDSIYHRVLGWSDVDALVNGSPADIVFGQPNFAAFGCNRVANTYGVTPPATLDTLCEPHGLAVDGSGNLYVADAANRRVLVFFDPFNTDQVADLSIGPLSYPHGVAVDTAGNVFVSETLSCKVLEYDGPLSSTDTTADRTFSQSCATAYFPEQLAVDASGNLYAGSHQFVTIWENAIGSDTTPDHTLGQAGPSTCNANGIESASTVCGPHGVAVDAAGHLYVADLGNSRILEFDTPLSVNQASRVFGQPDFTGTTTIWTDACNTGGPSASSLCLRKQRAPLSGWDEAGAVAVDRAGRLYVADGLNHRVLRYEDPLGSDRVADLVLGQTAMDRIQKPVVPVSQPSFTADNRSYNDLAVDTGNSRILIYSRYSDIPLYVVGQPDFTSTGCNTGGISDATLCNPTAATVDENGALWVADTGNNRVLQYDYPWSQIVQGQQVRWTTAAHVYGQPDFTSSNCGSGMAGLCAPRGVAVDDRNNLDVKLYISDTGNNRIVGHINPTADAIGDVVFGQPDFNATACNAGGLSASSLCTPRGLAMDGSGNLYIADAGNNRALVYHDVFAQGGTADRVYGQGGSMTTSACASGADGLCSPSAFAFDTGGNLLIADMGNDRVLEYDDPLSADTTADRVFGQPDFVSAGCNTGGVSGESLCSPASVSFSRIDDALFIGDSGNDRVLRFDAPYCIGDFHFEPRVPGIHSELLSAGVRVKYGTDPNADDDLLKFRGRFVLLESDGTIDMLGSNKLLTLSTANGIVFQQAVDWVSNQRVTAHGGVYVADLRDAINTGIEYFKAVTSFLIPANDNSPQRDRIRFQGHAIGLDLSAFTETSATLKLQFDAKCFTAALKCRSTGSGRTCRPVR
jgi:sugar lactone lactonase YvrE